MGRFCVNASMYSMFKSSGSMAKNQKKSGTKKGDFKEIKKQGGILCPVIDRTQKYLNKNATKISTGNESEIHQLGYNVIKNNGYTTEQRQYILANIVENTNISKYTIASNIRRCIA